MKLKHCSTFFIFIIIKVNNPVTIKEKSTFTPIEKAASIKKFKLQFKILKNVYMLDFTIKIMQRVSVLYIC